MLPIPLEIFLVINIMRTYSREEDTSWLDVQVHQVKGDTTLQVTVDPAYSDLTSDIRNA